MHPTRLFVALAVLAAALLTVCSARAASAQEAASPQGVPYAKVAPVFEKYCIQCHGGARPARGLRLDSYDNVMKGAGGEKVIVAGAPQKSTLFLSITGAKKPRMPRNGPPWLSSQESALIEEWIAAGARK